MKRTYILLICLSIIVANVFARPIDKNEALTAAKNYLSTNTSGAMRVKSTLSYQLAAIATDSPEFGTTESERNYFYVFNIGNNDGFIVVSGDTRTKAILGYSKKGSFNTQNMPDNMKYWLNNYKDEIKYAMEAFSEVSENVTLKSSPQQTSSSTSSVEPLLGLITYNQNAPYNDSCPVYNSERTVTGCVATAIAQVMRYHKWPATGTGTKTYTTATLGLTLSANFGTTTYDWENMPPAYNSSSTNAQKAAVATLMYHVGVGVNMNYNLSSAGGSGAQTRLGANTLYDYFGYDAGIQYYARTYFSESEWISKLKSEMDAGRPVVYAGRTTDNAGHAFVCDGYDANDLFHINWGWGGASNGYFELSALNPSQQGIGGSNGGYNLGQAMISGIQKPVEGSVHSQVMAMDSLTVAATLIPRGESVNFTVKNLWNYGAFTYPNGELVLALVQDGVVQKRLVSRLLSALGSFSGWRALSFDNVTFDSTIGEGEYQIMLYYKNEMGQLTPVLVNYLGMGKITANVTATTITFSTQNPEPTLNLTASPVASTNLYQKRIGNFDVKITNSGTREYFAQIGVRLVKTDDPAVTKNFASSLVHINIGEEKTIQFMDSILVAPGSYYVQVYADASNNQSSTTFPATLMNPAEFVPAVTVNTTPTTTPALQTVAGSVNMPSTVTIGEDFAMTADITNTGGYFDKNVIAFIFLPTPGSSVGYFGHHPLLIDYNQVKTAYFNGNITNLSAGNYLAVLYYRSSTGWTQMSKAYNFVLENPVTTVENELAPAAGVKLLNNPVFDKISVVLPEKTSGLIIYNLKGEIIKNINLKGEKFIEIPAGDFLPGIYILKVKTRNNVFSLKLIKK